ncbi:S-adenosyl-L-methionine-dependent methyltransferase [Nemania serpens]|nr:S-adenosyl-L-methionine-dependent methyltransferase [Nemania serpens]
MANPSQLLGLLNEIQDQVSAIHLHLSATSQHEPSFDALAPNIDYAGIDGVRALALDNLLHLRDLLSTPREILQYHTETDFVSRHVLDVFNIYNLVPVGETRTYEEIAAQTSPRLPTKTVRRLMRHAITQRVFCEVQPGVIAHTNVSRLLTEDKTIRDYYSLKGEDAWPAATRVADALLKWPDSTGPKHTGYMLAHGRPRHEIMAQDPRRNAKYDNAMRAFADDITFSTVQVVKGFDWAALGKATVVDVGGGMGTVSKALAESFPLLKFIVQDQPNVISNASVEDMDSKVKERVKFMEHDFFTAQPIKNADIYFFRRVFMEWEDDRAIQILRSLTPALKRGSRVLILDFYVPSPGACPLWQERRFRGTDMTAMAVANGAPRELDEWQALIETADAGFQFKSVRPVPLSELVFVEAQWAGEET